MLQAAEKNRAMAREEIKDTMVQVFFILGARDPISDQYRSKLTQILY